MKVLEKTVTLGEKQFKIMVNRDIAVETFEQFPEVIEYVLNSDTSAKGKDDEKEFLLNALKSRKLNQLFKMNEKLGELVAYALPLMMKSAGDMQNAQEIINYATENDVIEDFNAKMFGLLMEAFTPREQGKPKVKFSIK